jgi:hypothetical protein
MSAIQAGELSFHSTFVHPRGGQYAERNLQSFENSESSQKEFGKQFRKPFPGPFMSSDHFG